METDSVANEIQEGESREIGAERDLSPNNSTTEPHPLKQMLILWRVFKHLDTDGLITSRRVCRTWVDLINDLPDIEIPILINERNINSFNILMESPQAELSCRNVTLGYGVDLTTCSPTMFLETNGIEITTLNVKSEIQYLPFLNLPKNCPNLVKLDIQPNFIRSGFQVPNSLEQTWQNPFPHLKALTIRLINNPFRINYGPLGHNNHSDPGAKAITKFLILVLRKAHGLANLSLIRWDPFLYQNFVNELLQQPVAPQRIKNVHLDFRQAFALDPNNLISLSMTPELRLKSLELNSISYKMSTQSFSTLLKRVAPTLQKLKVMGNIVTFMPNGFELHFPCQMKSLKNLEIQCYRGRHPLEINPAPDNMPLVCSGSKDGNPCRLFENLPALTIFEQRSPYLGSKGSCERGGKHFWEAIFPVESLKNGFIQNALTEVVTHLIVPTCLIKEFARSFPCLKILSLGLENEGSMLEVVASLITLKIEQLEIYYYPTAKGIDEFSSAITGISLNDCRNYEELLKSGKEITKTHTSLTDWTDLRYFSVMFDTSTDSTSERQILSDVAVQKGFAKMTQLRTLALNGFQFYIHARHVETILDSVPLKSFDLEISTVIFVNSGEQNAANDVPALRNKYPHVELIITETEHNDEGHVDNYDN